jgi:hypothetical protein
VEADEVVATLEVRRESDGAAIANFRNTQLILWPEA